MAFFRPKIVHPQPQMMPHLVSFLGFIFFLLLLVRCSNSIAFNFSSFPPNMQDIFYQGDAFAANGVIQLTKNQLDDVITRSVGRASYAAPVRIWDRRNGKLADFMTHFTFLINPLNSSRYGDGLSFFLTPYRADIPENSAGGDLGLFSNTTASSPARHQMVAVEFDTFPNPWDPIADHVGINVNSIISKTNISWKSSIKSGAKANAWVSYNSSTKNLSVFLTYVNDPVFSGNSSLWYVVDLREILPEWISVGFSAATGSWIELHSILSWTFTSTLEEESTRKWNVSLMLVLVIVVGLLICCIGLCLLIRWRKRGNKIKKNMAVDVDIEDSFEKGAGPKRFKLHELTRATKNFTEEGKLGEGGFGGVYKGLLSETNSVVAVKRVSRGSKQGKKEYVSEVKIISRLRHRNLVQLIGWCHEQGEFLLVYEFMPNGSLDSHLFGGKAILTWNARYKIARGLASALLYLHEEWEQCVVHRDIKSSNVMLDSNYNAKLGDFGLARLVDHELGSQTTVLAGTMGYLAPECVTTGKASKESDVYSFGVVSLEIACGRRPVEPKAEPSKLRLVDWVWDLYGQGNLLDAVDKGLNKEFDEGQLEHLMVVGLWCCHPDHKSRPSIKQVINVINFEAPLPSLPSKQPVPMFYAPPMHLCRFSYKSSAALTNSATDRTRCSCGSCTSSHSAGSSKPLLQFSPESHV